MANEFKVKKGLIVDGSNTVLDVQGTAGQLFSITDSLTGDLFSISDVSGIPIFNVNSSGMSTFDGDVTIDKDSARLIIQDTGTGNALNQWISYRDNDGTERAYVGYGSTSNSTFYVVNHLSDLMFYAGGVLNETKSGANSTFAGNISLADGWTLQNVSGGYAKFSNWVNVSNTGLYTTEDMFFDLDDSTSRFVVRGVNNAELFEIDTSDGNSARFAGDIIVKGGDATIEKAAFPGGVLTLGREYSSSGDMTSALIQFQARNSSSTARTFAKIEGRSNGYDGGSIYFYTENSGTETQALLINENQKATFAGNVDIYTQAGSAEFNIGRNGAERLQIYQDDYNTTLTADNDSDTNGNHEFRLNRTFEGTGNNNFVIQKDGTAQLTINKNATATFAGDLIIPAAKALYLDGGGGTYIYQSSDGVIDFYGDTVQLFTCKQNGTQNEVVVNEGSGDVDFRVESNNNQYALFVDANNTGQVSVGTDAPKATFHVQPDGNGWKDGMLLEHHSGNTGWFLHPENNNDNALWFGYNSNTSLTYANQGATAVLKMNSDKSVVFEGAVNGLAGFDFATHSEIGSTSLSASNTYVLDVKKAYSSGNGHVAYFGAGANTIAKLNYDTVVVAQDDVTCLAIVEGNNGNHHATEQALRLAVGDNNAVISSTSTATGGMHFFVNRATTAMGYQVNTGTQALHLANTGAATFGSTVKATTYLVNHTSAAGIGGSLGAINSAELGPGYLSLSRDDTADAKQIVFEKADTEHGYIQTSTDGLEIKSGGVHFSTDNTFLSNYNYTFRDAVGINNPNSISAATSSTTTMAIGSKSGGNVNTSLITTAAIGVATAAPASILHVHGTQSYGTIRVSPTSANGESAMAFFMDTAGTTTGTAWVVGHAGWGNTGDFVIGNQQYGGPIMLIQQDGKVGIGNTSPSRQLHLKRTSGDVRGIMVETTVANSYAEVQVKAASEFRMGTGGSGTSVANQFYVYDATSGAHRFDIAANGYIGMGNTSPDRPLHVKNASDTPIMVESTDDTTGIIFKDNNSSNAFYYRGNGNYFYTTSKLTIGASTAGAKLDVSGDVIIDGTSLSDGDTVFDIQGDDGQLFSVTNSLTGDLFSVADVSGVPILNVHSSGDVDIDGELNVKNAATRFISLNYEDSVNSIISHSGTSYGLETLHVRGDQIKFYTDYDASSPKGDLTLTLDTSHNAIFAGDIHLTGGGTIEAPSSSGNEQLTFKAAGGVDFLIDSNGNSGDDQNFRIMKHTINSSSELLRVNEGGNVSVVAGNISVPQGSKMLFDGASGHTYLSESSDSNLKVIVAATEIINISNDRAWYHKPIRMSDGISARFGNDDDVKIYHSSGHGYIENDTGDLNYIQNNGSGEMIFTQNNNDGNINFNCDDGSNGVTTYLSLDGGDTLINAYKDIVLSSSTNSPMLKLQVDGVTSDYGLKNVGGEFQIIHTTTDVPLVKMSSAGKMGINTGNASIDTNYTLQVHGAMKGASLVLTNDGSNGGQLSASGAGNTTNAIATFAVTDSTSGADTVYIKQANTVYGANAVVFFYGSTESNGYIRVAPNGTVTYEDNSDYRLKENIKDLTGSLGRISDLRPVTFSYKNKPTYTHEGFVAHEAMTAIPNAVTGVKDGVTPDGEPWYQGVDMKRMIPDLVGAIKELKAQNEDLLNRVKALESK